MKTNFKEYLEKKKAQKSIDKIAKQYGYKKIILYGAGLFAGELFRNYDFSHLNIVGIADKKFENDLGDFYGYQKFNPLDLLENDFDLLLITTYDDTSIKNYLKNDLLQGENVKFGIKTLIGMNFFEYVKSLVTKELE
jgi:hypothetical protein